MKRFVVLVAAIAAGLTAPSAALAQRRGFDVLNDVAEQARGYQGQARGRQEERSRAEEQRPPEREPPRPQPMPQPPPQRRISEGQAIAAVRQVAPPGHHLDVFAREQGGRIIYTVRWASDNGQRRDYTVDGVTGAVR
jgi:uncharacterized membrane protein YkoI